MLLLMVQHDKHARFPGNKRLKLCFSEGGAALSVGARCGADTTRRVLCRPEVLKDAVRKKVRLRAQMPVLHAASLNV
jgi:hypothetical protein